MKQRTRIIIIVLAILFVAFSFIQNRERPIQENTRQQTQTHNETIIVHSPITGAEIESPLSIIGSARGSWFFEGNFVIQLKDENENIITQTIAKAQSDWMTESFVPFQAELIFDNSQHLRRGYLLFIKENPSGLLEYDDSLIIPVEFGGQEQQFDEQTEAQSTEQGRRTVELYYYNPDLDTDSSGNILCSEQGLVSVIREIPNTQTPIQETLQALIAGELTNEEIRHNITTEFPLQGLSLLGVNLNNRELSIEFSDPYNQTQGGACRVNILYQQIQHTAKQFEGVDTVVIIPETLFQP